MEKLKNPKYYLWCQYQGYNQELDQAITKAVGRNSSGSGYGLASRNITFDFYHIDAANRALNRLKKIKITKFGVKKLTSKVAEYINVLKD